MTELLADWQTIFVLVYAPIVLLALAALIAVGVLIAIVISLLDL